MDSIYLHGSEAVQNAARTMQGAADDMKQAVLNMDGALERHQRFLDDWLSRFEAALARQSLEAPHE